jgi:sulfate adenylyltransferase
MLRKGLSENAPIPKEFSKPEVLEILKAYYAGLDEKVEVKLHGAATGQVKK